MVSGRTAEVTSRFQFAWMRSADGHAHDGWETSRNGNFSVCRFVARAAKSVRGVYQDDSDPTWLVSAIHPSVIGAALHDHVARLQVNLGIVQ
jgi:hypothetical protein